MVVGVAVGGGVLVGMAVGMGVAVGGGGDTGTYPGGGVQVLIVEIRRLCHRYPHRGGVHPRVPSICSTHSKPGLQRGC